MDYLKLVLTNHRKQSYIIALKAVLEKERLLILLHVQQLLAETKCFDDGTIALDVLLLKISKETTTLTNQLHE